MSLNKFSLDYFCLFVSTKTIGPIDTGTKIVFVIGTKTILWTSKVPTCLDQ